MEAFQTGEAFSAAARRPYKGATVTFRQHKCSFNQPGPDLAARPGPVWGSAGRRRRCVSELRGARFSKTLHGLSCGVVVFFLGNKNQEKLDAEYQRWESHMT